jgi:arylsulfatase A-like enzyme
MNFLLISIDTLRVDHLGCYGYSRPTSPTLDRLAASGALCEQFLCPAIPTHPSYTTFYTGQHPITHGVVAHGGNAALAAETPVLPELLVRAGYATCAVDNLARSKPWFSRGYEFYIDPSLRRSHALMVSAEELNHRAIPWLRAHAHDPFFLFIHYWDPHTPYLPPERYRSLFYDGDPCDPRHRSLEPLWSTPLGQVWRDTWFKWLGGRVTDAAYVAALYDGAIRYLDDEIARLLRVLDETGAGDDTLVLLFGDHGESLTEHGIYFDHHGLYDCTLRVPLIARWPGRIPAGRRLPQLVQHTDLAPTLLDAAGLTIPETMEGRSLLPLLTGASSEGHHSRLIAEECTWQAKWALRDDRYKFILARQPDLYGSPARELYDLSADPGEARNLAGERPDLARELEAELEGWIAGRLKASGRTVDPLIEQGITLGRRYYEARYGKSDLTP